MSHLTVKNRATEETDELEQEVLVRRLELVVTERGSSLLDVVFRNTLLHRSLEPEQGQEKQVRHGELLRIALFWNALTMKQGPLLRSSPLRRSC